MNPATAFFIGYFIMMILLNINYPDASLGTSLACGFMAGGILALVEWIENRGLYRKVIE